MSSRKELPSIEYLRQVLDYNPDTGYLYWRVDIGSRAKAGNKITRVNSGGYIYFGLDKIQYLGHRIAWTLYYGKEPNFEIDHIDGNTKNNVITNLRKANRIDQNRNKRIQKNNTSGFKGIHFKQENQKWCARVFINKKAIHLGYFDDAKSAYEAYCNAAKKYFGEFARIS